MDIAEFIQDLELQQFQSSTPQHVTVLSEKNTPMPDTHSANHQDYSGDEEDDKEDNASQPPPLPTALSAHELVGSNPICMFIAANDKLKKKAQ